MRLFLCAAVLITVSFQVFAYPTDVDVNVPQPAQSAQPENPKTGEKQPKQSLFGLEIDVNMSKNGTLLPSPAFINTSASLGEAIGANGNFMVPLVPFPLALLFSGPPLNITVGFNASKNLSAALVASTGNSNSSSSSNSSSGWGWPAPPSDSGWGWTTTPPPDSGWGWTTMPPPSSGWGWGWSDSSAPSAPIRGADSVVVRKGVGASSNAASLKPQQNSVPKPNSYAKPAPSDDKPTDSESPVIIMDIAESSLSSEMPAAEVPAKEPEALPVLENNDLAPVQQEEAPAAQSEVLSEDPAPLPESPVENPDAKLSSPVNSNAVKTKRHAGVEQTAALRIEDFEDVESPNEMNAPPMQEQEDQDVSKEEMILLAMEQNSNILPGAVVQLGNARPAPIRPGLPQLQVLNKPVVEAVDESDESAAADLRNAESPSVAPVGDNGFSKSVSKGKPESEAGTNGERGGRNKPRPYGMDKPSKNRPILDSGMKDKVEQFGLPHYSSDLVQKEQFQLPSGATLLGWQIPDIKWSSFAAIFQNFIGSRHKNSMGKSDPTSSEGNDEECIDEESSEAVRSPIISSGRLCQSGASSCNEACISSGFASGNCLGPYPTPGCLCRMPNHKELAMMLSPQVKAPTDDVQEVLENAAAPACKKCECAESCKASGSYTGFCIDKCYCAVPWYTREI